MRIQGVTNIQFLAKGSHGEVYTGTYKRKKVSIKVKREASKSQGTAKREAEALQLANTKGVGPKLLKKGKNYVMYEFQEGTYFKTWLKTATSTQKKKAFKDLLKQCYALDKLGISKEEMSRPLTNCVVVKGKPVLIDFERSHKTDKPKNVTQFCQFLMKEYPKKKTTLRKLAQAYKNKPSLNTFNKIVF
tara:strand:- start:97 stop:663 length:567 start_codon:yes stop_codon:yes gene_type:complete